jgi:rfaE bifunctional protein kinase chain/domain
MTLSVPRERLSELFHRARAQRVVVVGDAMLDVYLAGDVERISPEAPVPVVRVRERRHALGGAANVVQNVIAIGAQCDLVGAVGDDRAGETLREMIQGVGAQPNLVVVDRCTTQKTRIVARSQQLVRVDEEEDAELTAEETRKLTAANRIVLAEADALILEDYNKGVLSPSVVRQAIELANARGIPVIVDPKYKNFFAFGGATVFKPNRRELEAALGAAVDLEHPETVPATLARLGVEYLLLTLGERGMVLFGAQGEVARIPALAREVYDVVGAGDTVSAYLATMLAAGATIVEAAVIANAAAGIEVGKLGAATVSPDEIMAALHGASAADEVGTTPVGGVV